MIDKYFTSIGHAQANGETELANKTLLHGLKIRLNQAEGLWVDEIPKVLWSIRNTPNSVTGKTSYSLTYGIEVVIPVEIGMTN